MEAQVLREVVLEATAKVPPRIPLQNAMSKLSQLHPSSPLLKLTLVNAIRVKPSV